MADACSRPSRDWRGEDTRDPHGSRARAPIVVGALIAAWWLAVYLPGAGTGLVKDDFAWIAGNPVHAPGDVWSIFGRNNGFYRPVVALTFAANHAVFGLEPLGFGLTNVCLAILAALAIARLARTVGLPPVAAVMAAGIWSLNPHGINMAVLWTSGRTALLLTLFSVLAATCWVRERPVRAAAWTLAALLSKEEAVVLPFVLIAWSLVGPRRPGLLSTTVRRAVPVIAVLALYLVMRAHSGAFTPLSAPPYYRFATDWRLLIANAGSYLDRAATFSVAVVLLGLAAARRLPRWDSGLRAATVNGLIWLVAGFALTVWVPVRSSLYACFPSVGAALAASAWLAAGFSRRPPLRLWPAVAVVGAAAFVATQAYWARNERWLEPARVSAAVVRQVPALLAGQPPGTVLVIRDRADQRRSVASAFGTVLPEAVRLATGREDVAVWLEPPPGEWQLAGWSPPAETARRLTVALDGRDLRPVGQPDVR